MTVLQINTAKSTNTCVRCVTCYQTQLILHQLFSHIKFSLSFNLNDLFKYMQLLTKISLVYQVIFISVCSDQ